MPLTPRYNPPGADPVETPNQLPTAQEAAQAARKDPTTPGDKEKPTALGSAVNTATIGTGASVVVVWLIDTYATANGQHITLNVEQAVAIGGFGAAVIAYITQVAHAVIQVLLNKLDKFGD